VLPKTEKLRETGDKSHDGGQHVIVIDQLVTENEPKQNIY